MARTYHKDHSSPIPLANTQSQLYLSKSDPELDSNQKKKKKLSMILLTSVTTRMIIPRRPTPKQQLQHDTNRLFGR